MAQQRNFAVVFLVSGAFLSIIAFVTSLDTAMRPWSSVSIITSVGTTEQMEALAAVEPGPDEWPLSVARTYFAKTDTTSNRYTVEVTPIRGTALLRIDVIGRSPDRTTAFSRWLIGYLARDLSSSLTSHGIAQPYHLDAGSLVSEAPGPAVPLRLHPGTLALSLITPLLLLLSGIVLYRASRAGRPKT